MVKIHKKTAAIALSFLTAFSAFSHFSVVAESDNVEKKTVTIHFDFGDDDFRFDVDEDGNLLEITDIQADANSSVRLPDRYINKDGYNFSGWTYDGVRGYPVDSVIQVGEEDITLTPVWRNADDKVFYNIVYKVEIDGEDIELPKQLQKLTQREGGLVNVSLFSFDYPGNTYAQIGWIYNGMHFMGSQYIIMPDHDIELTPNWLKFYKLNYTPGDVDRLNGVTSSSFDRLEKQPTDLAEAGRFSRNGFKIIGWTCDYDGQVYAPLSGYTMPSSDVTFTAVWEPLTYNVVFMGNTGKSEDILRVEGKTDSTIICPEMTGTKSGYYFDGWQFDEKIDGKTVSTIYKPGDEFLIKGTKPGMGISLKAVWVEGTPPVVTPERKYGDSNCDGEIRLSDAVLIMQAIGNPDAYGVGGSDATAITETGVLNADCYNTGDGLTNLDAIAVQRYILKLIPELPEKSE